MREKDAPKGALKCMDCDYKSTDDEEGVENYYIIKETVDHTEKSKIEIVERDIDSGGIPEEMLEELREQYRESLENFDI